MHAHATRSYTQYDTVNLVNSKGLCDSSIHRCVDETHQTGNRTVFSNAVCGVLALPLSPTVLAGRRRGAAAQPLRNRDVYSAILHLLTKSSPESAPREVMDSLLMVRGMRTVLRGAVAASSAIFFFNLANMSVLPVSVTAFGGRREHGLHSA